MMQVINILSNVFDLADNQDASTNNFVLNEINKIIDKVIYISSIVLDDENYIQ